MKTNNDQHDEYAGTIKDETFGSQHFKVKLTSNKTVLQIFYKGHLLQVIDLLKLKTLKETR